jgi:phosphoribosylcarboxyaminoimidazole (NCAIR) mutase
MEQPQDDTPFKMQFGGTTVGWIGERSVPIPWALGYESAMSMAQMPVPVPMSSISLVIGKCNHFVLAHQIIPFEPLIRRNTSRHHELML